MTKNHPILTKAQFIELLHDDQWRIHTELDNDCDRTVELADGDMEFHGLGKVFAHHGDPDAEDRICIYYAEAYSFRLLTADSLKTGGGRAYVKDLPVLGEDGELLTDDEKTALLPPPFTTCDYRLVQAALAVNKT